MNMIYPGAPEIVVPLNHTEWTDELFQLAKKLWTEGKSATQIGLQIGKSRNAIIGKLMRNGLQRGLKDGVPRVPGIRYHKKRIAKLVHDKRKPWAADVGAEATELPAEQADNPMTLMQLHDHHCRWPCAGAGIETIFCGGQVIGGQYSYCARHCRMAYAPDRPRRAAA